MTDISASRTSRLVCFGVALMATLGVGIVGYCAVDALVVWPRFFIMVDFESSPHFAYELLALTLTYPAPPIAAYGLLLVARQTQARSRVILPLVMVYVSAICAWRAVSLHTMVGLTCGDLFATELIRMLPASLIAALAFRWVFDHLTGAEQSSQTLRLH